MAKKVIEKSIKVANQTTFVRVAADMKQTLFTAVSNKTQLNQTFTQLKTRSAIVLLDKCMS